jgi:membrane-bound metal-dependent hydrolase YbcI (DUF457 family)
MLGINHVTLATASVLGLSVYLHEPFFLPLLAYVAFAALIPDIDHQGSEMSKLIPVVNKAFKHRGITHSFLGMGVFAFGTNLILGYGLWVRYLLIVVAFFGVYYLDKFLTVRVANIKSLGKGFISKKQTELGLHILDGLLYGSLLITSLLIWQGRLRQEILVMLVLGFMLHTLGDFVTKEGVPLLWPIKQKFGLKLFRTGSWVEGLIGGILLIVNVALIIEFWNMFEVSSPEYWMGYFSL